MSTSASPGQPAGAFHVKVTEENTVVARAGDGTSASSNPVTARRCLDKRRRGLIAFERTRLDSQVKRRPPHPPARPQALRVSDARLRGPSRSTS